MKVNQIIRLLGLLASVLSTVINYAKSFKDDDDEKENHNEDCPKGN